MSEEHVTPPGVTAEQLQQGREVAAAAQQAAREEPDPAKRKLAAARAMRREAQRVQLELTEEQARMIAGYVVDDMEARGAFEPPPEPVAAPQPATEPAPPTVPAEAAEPPRKRTLAERFRSS